MIDFNEKLQGLVGQEDLNGLNELFEETIQSENLQNKIDLADAFLSVYSQWHYDYNCGKFNEVEDIKLLFSMMENVKRLNPQFESHDYFVAHIHEMLAHTYDDEALINEHRKKCISYLVSQLEKTPNDYQARLDLVDNLFRQSKVSTCLTESRFNELQKLLDEAFELELLDRERSFQRYHFSSINNYICLIFKLLQHDEWSGYSSRLADSLNRTIDHFLDEHPYLHHFAADTYFNLINHSDHPNAELYNANEETLNDVWLKLKHHADIIHKERSYRLTNIDLTSIYTALAEYFQETDYYYTSLLVQKANFDGENIEWYMPKRYAHQLRDVALFLIKNDQVYEAQKLYDEAIDVLKTYQSQFTFFELYQLHGELLLEYIDNFGVENVKESILAARSLFQTSLKLSENHYTQPFYSLAKTYLLLGEKSDCLEVLRKAVNVFSNEYHTHDFIEIFEDDFFQEIHNDLKVLCNEYKR